MNDKKQDPKKREREAFDRIVNSVDPDKLRDAADAIHELGAHARNFEILRAKILALDGINSPAGEGDRRTIWQLAEELSMALGDPLETLASTERILDRIVDLDPSLKE